MVLTWQIIVMAITSLYSGTLIMSSPADGVGMWSLDQHLGCFVLLGLRGKTRQLLLLGNVQMLGTVEVQKARRH